MSDRSQEILFRPLLKLALSTKECNAERHFFGNKGKIIFEGSHKKRNHTQPQINGIKNTKTTTAETIKKTKNRNPLISINPFDYLCLAKSFFNCSNALIKALDFGSTLPVSQRYIVILLTPNLLAMSSLERSYFAIIFVNSVCIIFLPPCFDVLSFLNIS